MMDSPPWIIYLEEKLQAVEAACHAIFRTFLPVAALYCISATDRLRTAT
jgi:hypothetical protein